MSACLRGPARRGAWPAWNLVVSLFVTLMLSALAARPSFAEWSYSPEAGNLIEDQGTLTVDTRRDHSACPDGSGGFFLAWQSGDATHAAVFVQHVDANGEAAPGWPRGGIVPGFGATLQRQPGIILDRDGGVIVAWIDASAGPQGVVVQRLTASGAKLWGEGIRIASATSGLQPPVLAPDSANGAYVAWTKQAALADGETRMTHVLADGSIQPGWDPQGKLLGVWTFGDRNPALAADSLGGCWVAWQDWTPPGDFEIEGLHILSSGAIAPGWNTHGDVLCLALRDQSLPRVVTDSHGGAYFVWQDDRAASNDLYMLHLDAGATAPHGSDQSGDPVVTGPGNQVFPQVCLGGNDDLYVVWEDSRLGPLCPFAQRMTTAGTRAPSWPAEGLRVGASQLTGDSPVIAPDGAGGAYVVFVENVTGGRDVVAVHANPFTLGTVVPICIAPGLAFYPLALADGQRNVLITWWDGRDSRPDHYAQRLDPQGALGDARPAIVSIEDVPADQGGHVRITFMPSTWEIMHPSSVASYDVIRHDVDPDGSVLLTLAARVSPSGAAVYSVVAGTLADSTSGGAARATFTVDASATIRYWQSAPDSGCSVDNLAPVPLAHASGVYANRRAVLGWDANTEPDLVGYAVYRGPSPAFTPSPATHIATTATTGYVDAAVAPSIYKLTAIDVHGNESPAVTVIPTGVLGVEGTAPAALELAIAGANPARDGAALRFELPHAARVRLVLHDAAGRLVRTLADGTFEPGTHVLAWDGRDSAGRAAAAGLYFARLEAAGEVRHARLVVVH